MNNPIGIVTPVQFATKLATEYDSCMRRGGQLIGKNAIMVGNLPTMLSLITVAQFKAIAKTQPGKHSFLTDIGKAVEGYWTGATLMPFPIYPIPAPGSIQNLIINSAMVTNPGKWPTAPFEIPTKSSLTFLESFVMFAKIHLFQVQGIFMTTSLYPSAPSPIPAPGVANWMGYTIPNVPMFGLSLNQNTDSETKNQTGPNSPLNPNLISAGDIVNKPKSIITTEAERNAIDNKFPQDKLGSDALEYQDDVINDELRTGLSNSITLDDKVALVLDAERKKDALGLDRFYSKAIQSIGDFKNTLPDTDAQMKKSLSQLQKELKKEKQLCCNDCD
jgi:hypothetical protein